MKTFSLVLFAAIGLINTSAFAFPTVGDTATYDVTQSLGGQTVKGEMIMTVTDVNESTDVVTVMTSINGQSQGSSERSFDELTGLFGLVDHCAEVNGSTEIVATAGTRINTCKLHQELDNESGKVTGDIWFGKIPFGIVKSVVSQESSAGTLIQTMLLKSYKMN